METATTAPAKAAISRVMTYFGSQAVKVKRHRRIAVPEAAEIFKVMSAMGRIRTEARAKASRENGKLGGRKPLEKNKHKKRRKRNRAKKPA